MLSVSFEQASGRDDSQIDRDSLEQPVHRLVVDPLRQLKASASAAGFELRIASGYRDYERQLSIWNRKSNGQLPLLDEHGQPLNAAHLSPRDRLYAILRWSALPGGSRHHWGSEVDVYDAAAVDADYRLQLTEAEYAPGGPFAEFSRWLTEALPAGDFYRPYRPGAGGVAPEPWHLSYRPLAAACGRAFSDKQLRELIAGSDMALKQVLLEDFDTLYTEYIGCYLV